ncbi:hypothetical protein [Promicromonospora sp. NFX87]|uniref:hypothetical protein n=1 Tax=Promicromonospora sp. NFX87 TaxID=3402691 RepID=UPI003AFA3BFA
MTKPIKIDVVAQADLKDLKGLGTTLDDVADNGESMGAKIEQSLKDMEAKARPTNTEFKALARSLDDLAKASGKSKTEALDDLKAAAENAGQAIDQGVLEALHRIASQGESNVQQTVNALKELRDEAKRVDDTDPEIKVEADTDTALTKVQDLGNEIKASLGETMGELAGTFAENGFNMEDAFDGVLEVSSETASLIPGPWSLAAQAVIVGLAGLVGESKKTQEEIAAEAEEKAQRYESAYKTAFENITTAGVAMGEELTINSNVNAILQDSEKLAEATKVANDLGVDRGNVLRALAGDEAAYQGVLSAGNGVLDSTNERYDELANKMLFQGGLTKAEQREYDELLDAREAARNALDETTDSYGTNSDSINAATDAMKAKNEQDKISADRQIDVAKGLARSSGEAQNFEVTIDGATHALKVMPNGKVIDVSDEGTSRLTQREINRIDGKNVSIGVNADTSSADSSVATFRHRTYSIPATIQLRAV